MRLTQTVSKGGCAAKVPALILREILSGVRFPPTIDGVTVDGSLFDDAAIFKINDAVALVQTLDFFTPIIDSPYNFGAVAAANALSDVYAMGGRPKTCMAILAAPMATMKNSVIQEVLQGASDVIAKSGSSLVGGHSIDDDTLKFGLSVTGLVHPQKVWKNDGAQAEDILILTKPLGTGTLCAGLKKGEYNEDTIADVIVSMKRLNNVIDYMTDLDAVHAATDITGFGLAGHSLQMAMASKASLQINFSALPVFEQTLKSLSQGNLTKAHRSNNEYTHEKMSFANSVNEIERLLAFDPQTSGGLLLSVHPKAAQEIISELQPHFPGTAIIGCVKPKELHYVTVE